MSPYVNVTVFGCVKTRGSMPDRDISSPPFPLAGCACGFLSRLRGGLFPSQGLGRRRVGREEERAGRGPGQGRLSSRAQRGGGREREGGDDFGVPELSGSETGAVAGGRKSWRPWTLSHWGHRGRWG